MLLFGGQQAARVTGKCALHVRPTMRKVAKEYAFAPMVEDDAGNTAMGSDLGCKSRCSGHQDSVKGLEMRTGRQRRMRNRYQ